ncbi:Zn(2)-C6 fungal-type DNA-binding domain protein [Cordyceps fumosorosea ARSEF 2679]|uniref:Zn(2)-C6 fungal-type DNA-binding domain protein n=1 Tax=Cordyceps fumosorosea (strain ARSEF 2679) TaxID=1081104 RepID=A0A167LQ47_CORFA|nr:Zn(2)-C6 fungal-type DNA-binding domain protein [Cordyceps fumosorosea ARSEF 2679]OAA53361.1 Zn(2)-C6 fungal-type DNA-binding domain protein [Cordyceps fumosorosea ARSEF 2679]
MASVQGRKRSRLACQTCRELKRKCDGAEPCGTCVRFEYPCRYSAGSRIRSRTDHHHAPQRSVGLPQCSPIDSGATPASSAVQHQARSLEANSGPAFVRRLGFKSESGKGSPRVQTFAWNAFLGSRQTVQNPLARPVTELLSQHRMTYLAGVYFQKLHPTYSFIDAGQLEAHVRLRWSRPSAPEPGDALLCGVAALGCLFSQVHADRTEPELVESARRMLEGSFSEPPSVAGISAWLLRVIYLRLAGTHYPAWMASCTVLHMLEAAGMTVEDTNPAALRPDTQEAGNVEVNRRLLAVAQHLNTWMSYDMGLSRVALSSVTCVLPSKRPGEFTTELMELLPFTIQLDPERTQPASELESALQTVLDRVHTRPPSVLGQCNLALCLCRRLRSMEFSLPDATIQRILVLTASGIRAARAILEDRAPWHHMAYVPFQVVCVLLAIDTVASISQLRDAVQCLRDVAEVYNTHATREAVRTARSLVMLHQRGKEMLAAALGDVVKMHDVNAHEDVASTVPVLSDEFVWLNNLPEDISNLQDLGLEQLLSPEFFWNASSS